ncbi:MAG: aromatic-ring-hydroxylating dioxygenase subunit beta [Sphingorhabdus sp.]
MTKTIDTITLDDAVVFISLEADLLDHRDYTAWLSLWAANGMYIIPIDTDSHDYANQLNYAYDDAAMRRMRTARLTNGESISAREASNTLRSVSRFRLLDAAPSGSTRVRCAQQLVEYRRGTHRNYSANVTYTLSIERGRIMLAEKVVCLINSSDALAGMSFLL